MEQITLKLIGKTPLLMHSARGADPMDPLTRELKKYTSNRKKTDDIHETIARLEWELGLYHDPELGPYMPTVNIRASIIQGGRKNKLGTTFEQATMLLDERARLDYTGPRELDKLWEAGSFRDVRRVCVGPGGVTVMRTRPIFRPPWSVEFTMLYDPEYVQKEQLIDSTEKAGLLIGVCDFRPSSGGGMFGRFGVEVVR